MTFSEEFKVILLAIANKVLGVVDVAMGGKDFVPVDMKIIFSITLKSSTFKIKLVHNNPSGKLKPRSQDKAITTKAFEAGKLLDIEECDYIIFSEDGFYSLKDEGDF